MLQAIGRADLPVKIMTVGVIIKLVGNITLMKIPEISIDGAAISTSICYFVICIWSLISLKKLTGVKFDFLNLFIKPTFAAILCGATAFLSNDYLNERIQSKISVLISIAFGGLIYLLSLYLQNINKIDNLRDKYLK